ncbi:MAG: heme-binding protein [Albidovulum sp.]
MLGIDAARTMISEALLAGANAGMKPLSVVVLDAGGHLIAFERSDGAAVGRFEIARAKAYGSVMLGMAGRAQMARAEAQPFFMAALTGVYDGRILPVPGGVLIRDSAGEIVGAVGVTGDTSDNDALAAEAGIRAAGYTPEA